MVSFTYIHIVDTVTATSLAHPRLPANYDLAVTGLIEDKPII